MPIARSQVRKTSRARRRGVAMMLVLIAVALAVILSVPFVQEQMTASGIARNAQDHTRARTIAESALTVAIDHVRTHADWRATQPNGAWCASHSFNGGLITIIGEDDDGDLDDNPSDAVLLTGIGEFGGVTHRVSARLSPRPTSAVGVCLFILKSLAGPDAEEQAWIDLIESWGYDVITIDDDASQNAFDAAALRADVMYIRHGVNAAVADRITHLSIGIVTEHGGTYPVLGFSASDATYAGTAVNVTEANHPLTTHLGAGSVELFHSPQLLKALAGAIGDGVITLAQRTSGSATAFAALHIGAARYGGGTAPARRVMLPWGDDPFDLDSLNDDGLNTMRRAIEWAAAGLPDQPAAALTGWQSGTLPNATDGDKRLLVFVATTEGDHTITSVTYGGQPMKHVADDGIFTPSEWGKAFMYVLDDRGITAASGSGFHVSHSGDDDAWKFASRMYQHVDQTNPIRASGGQTQGDNPSTITSGFIEARPGDIAVAVVHCGEETSYTWGQLFVEGVDHSGNSFTLSAADRTIIDPPGPIQSQATAGRANRQVLITAMLAAAANGDDDDADTPQLICLWDFHEVPIPDPKRLGHWKLDDAVGGSSVLGIAAQEDVTLHDHSLIDSYDSAIGPYGDENRGSNAYVGTNYNTGRHIIVSRSEIRGHAYCGVGGDPARVIHTSAGGAISGIRDALLDAMLIFPQVAAPSGMPASERSKNFRTDQVWSQDHVYRDLAVDGCDITVVGDVRVYATEKIEFKRGARLIIPPGSSLSLYGDRDIIFDDARINDDTRGASRLHVYMRDDEEELIIKNNARVCGIMYTRNDLEISCGGELWGAVQAYDDIALWSHAAIHMDLALGGAPGGAEAAGETVAGNNGSYRNGPDGHQPGRHGTAVRFDGINDHLAIPHHDSYAVSEGSVALWFRADNLAGTQGLFVKDAPGFGDGGHLLLLLHNGRIEFHLQSATADHVTRSQPIEPATWYHVTATFGMRGMQLFVNGIGVDRDKHTGGLAPRGNGESNVEAIILGAVRADGPYRYAFGGSIDDVQLFDQALDAEQVAGVMAGNDPGPSNLPGPVVADTSGYGDPLDLVIDNLNNIAWTNGGGLTFADPAAARSLDAAAKLYDALTATNELTVEIIFTPANTTQIGPARIATYSDGDAAGNFMIGQNADRYVTRLRTSDTFSDGSPEIESPAVLAALARQHVLVSYNGEDVKLYRNGALESTHPRTGTFAWDPSLHFILGNESDDSAPWRGALHRVAIYDRAIDITQAGNLFKGLPPGPPGRDGDTGYTYVVRWLEAK